MQTAWTRRLNGLPYGENELPILTMRHHALDSFCRLGTFRSAFLAAAEEISRTGTEVKELDLV